MKATCCHCGKLVNLDEEGVTYGNGQSAHEGCDDAHEFNKANGADFAD